MVANGFETSGFRGEGIRRWFDFAHHFALNGRASQGRQDRDARNDCHYFVFFLLVIILS